jgi:mannan endo-1,4-beta-mannosidase
MRPRIVMLLAFVIAAVAVGFTGARFTLLPSPHPPVHKTLPSGSGSYFGVFELGSPPSYQPIEQFAEAAGKEPNLIGYYSGWAEPFDASFARMVYRHGLIPFVQIDPSFASVAAIAAGAYDGYLRLYADSVRDFGHQVVIGFGHEMNAKWYSWGYTKTLASTFVAAWQHIVSLFRAEGADNVTWLWTIQADQQGKTGPIGDWWPGPSYVTWVGIDGYYMSPKDTFDTVFSQTIRQVGKLTNKPILLSETGVTPKANQFSNINNLFQGISQSNALGLVWFDVNQTDYDTHIDWRIENDPLAESAFHGNTAHLSLVSIGGR